MRKALDLFRHERNARLFLLAHAQSSLGTGAAYVGLVVLVYDRHPSPWAITAVLLAEFLPGMVLGPLFGAAADRWPRRACAIVADGTRALAFVAIAMVGSFELTIAFATVAGAATGLYRPAVFAALPGLVSRRRSDAATAVFSSFTDMGYTAGPALAALVLLLADAELLMLINGASFAVSVLILTRISFGSRAERPIGRRPSLLREAIEGLRAAAERPGVRTVILASSGVVMFAGLFNVGELLLAERELGAGGTGYSILVTVYGAAVGVGSLTGSRGGTVQELARNFSAAILLVGAGMVGAGLAPSFGVALGAFALAGFGNGLVVVHERLLLQHTVPDAVLGRVFGVGETLGSWAFGFAFIAGGAIASLLGTRPLLITAGTGVLVVWAIVAVASARAFAGMDDVILDDALDEDVVEDGAISFRGP